MDLIWVGYHILIALYCTEVVRDWFSAFILTSILFYYSGIIGKKAAIVVFQLSLWIDIGIKAKFADYSTVRRNLDLSCYDRLMAK